MPTRTRPISSGCSTRSSCAHTRFPLGELTKPEVREIAAELGLPTADKPESQEICFVPAGDYRELLRRATRLRRRARADRRRRWHGGRHPHRLCALHRRAAARPWRGARRGGLRARGAPCQQHGGDRSSRRGRRVQPSPSMAAASWPGSRRRSASRIGPHPAPRAGRAGGDHPAWRRSVRGRDRRARSGRRPRARRAVLYDGDVCLGGGRIARAA